MSDPNTYDEALEQGFEPLADLGKFLQKRGLGMDAFHDLKLKFAEKSGVSCETSPVGSKCFDWTDDQGVRTICFCIQAKTCGQCVQKVIDR